MISQADIDEIVSYQGDLPSGTSYRHPSPFVVPPGKYFVSDADTLYLRGVGNLGDVPGTAYGLRMRSVMAPEKPALGLVDQVLKRHGMPYSPGHPGVEARNQAVQRCKGRAILVIPHGEDKYGRMLCDIYVSGRRGNDFDLSGAFSLEHDLASDRNILQPALLRWKGGERRPPYEPTIEQLQARMGEDPTDRFWGNDGFSL